MEPLTNEQREELDILSNRTERDRILNCILSELVWLRKLPREEGGMPLELDHYTLNIYEMVTGIQCILAKADSLQCDKERLEHKAGEAVEKLREQLVGIKQLIASKHLKDKATCEHRGQGNHCDRFAKQIFHMKGVDLIANRRNT